jgi:UDP-N-acetylmuramate: L-alanyl-gamma-D-glutamyl-meso-diaminopimelate ligase
VKIHLIAIGGAVMHNLALELHANGHTVSGSDDQIFEPSLSRLKAVGLLPEKMGWFPEKLADKPDLVILGMHARIDNPELVEAQRLGIKIWSFPEFVYQHAAEKQRLVVAGSHGKTTITAMVMHVLKFHQYDFDYLVGSQLEGFERMVRLSDAAKIMVIEGDEYLASPLDPRPKFLHYKPHAAVISGIAWDHINVFPTYAQYVAQFDAFLQSLAPHAILGYYDGDADLVELASKYEATLQLKPYHGADYVIDEGFTFIKTSLGLIPIQVFGKHNMANIAAARILTEAVGISKAEFYQAIASFKGTARRLEAWPVKAPWHVYRDFAHAPSKVAATVEAVCMQHPDQTKVACLELHTFSSLNKDFLPLYKGSMDGPEHALVYFNPETIAHKKLAPIQIEDVKKAFDREDLEVFTSSEALYQRLQVLNSKPCCCLLMSSGNFDNRDLKALFAPAD